MEPKSRIDFPISEIKYQQHVEEMTKLIPFLKDEMKNCPDDSLEFSLIEIVDFYSLKRDFRIKLKTTNEKNLSQLQKFYDIFLTNISLLDSFIVIPDQRKLIQNKIPNNKGLNFKSPKVFNINGDESFIGASGEGNVIIFVYNNEKDLEVFLEKVKVDNIACYCLSINMGFLEHKKWLKNKGFLEMRNIGFYFVDNDEEDIENSSNLKFFNLPRIVLIGSDNKIIEDKCIKNIFSFDLKNDLVSNNVNIKKNDEKLNTKFILLENDLKKKIVRSMNSYLKKAGLEDVHFYVKSKVCIDKNGVKKTRCYPVFFGETNNMGNSMVDNLVNNLNEKDLFNDVQNRINVTG